MMRAVIAITSLLAVAGACSPHGAETAPHPPSSALTRSERNLDGSDMLGRWELRRRPPVRGGIRLELVVDSAAGPRFRANVARLLVGNAGVDPEEFAATWGAVSPSGTVRLPINRRDGVTAAMEIDGTLTGDTVTVTAFAWGGEAMMRDAEGVWLVRIGG
jgi:hypothetical protein